MNTNVIRTIGRIATIAALLVSTGAQAATDAEMKAWLKMCFEGKSVENVTRAAMQPGRVGGYEAFYACNPRIAGQHPPAETAAMERCVMNLIDEVKIQYIGKRRQEYIVELLKNGETKMKHQFTWVFDNFVDEKKCPGYHSQYDMNHAIWWQKVTYYIYPERERK